MQSLTCPDCQSEHFQHQGKSAHCDDCGHDFTVSARCNVCEQPLSPLKACGAVDYFCDHCNELKSKKVVIWCYQAME